MEEIVDTIRQKYVRFIFQEELAYYLEDLREQNDQDIEFEDLDIRK